MALKKYKPVTPSMRGRVGIDRTELFSGKPIKGLIQGQTTKAAGRNNRGKITVYHRGGGHKRRYRHIDWLRNKYNVVGEVLRLEYDPFRTAYISLIRYSDGELLYTLSADGLKAGDTICAYCTEHRPVRVGDAMPLRYIPEGVAIHNVELLPGKGGQLARAAGSFVRLVKRDNRFATLELTSGRNMLLPLECMATLGRVSNIDHRNIVLGKAGVSRHSGWRPTVRGIAMNPIDHPHGGRTNGGRPSVTPWGIITKGHRTRHRRKNRRS